MYCIILYIKYYKCYHCYKLYKLYKNVINVILQQLGTRLATVWHCRSILLQLSRHFRCRDTSNLPSTHAALPWETFRPPRKLFKASRDASECIRALQGEVQRRRGKRGREAKGLGGRGGDLIKHKSKERGEEKVAFPTPS